MNTNNKFEQDYNKYPTKDQEHNETTPSDILDYENQLLENNASNDNMEHPLVDGYNKV